MDSDKRLSLAKLYPLLGFPLVCGALIVGAGRAAEVFQNPDAWRDIGEPLVGLGILVLALGAGAYYIYRTNP